MFSRIFLRGCVRPSGEPSFYSNTDKPHNSAFQGTGLFLTVLQEMPYFRCLELKENIQKLKIYIDTGGISLLADALLGGSSVCQ